MKFMLKDITKATGGHLKSGDSLCECDGISIDSRDVRNGQLFVCIKGAHFDGHAFMRDAMAKGAPAIVARRGADIPDGAGAIEVEDTENALGDIAAWWREQFDVPCIAITGSNGKSTTKEMTAAVVGALGELLKTEGNFNNLIGLPLTVFRWERRHRIAILEMGMNATGEIKRLAEIARPDVGLITNVTAAHLERLHTVEAVACAKGELFDVMAGRGVAIVNNEDPWIRKIAASYGGKKILFGMRNDCDVRFLNMETEGLDSIKLSVAVMEKEYHFTLPVPGTHNVMNALAAISIGVAIGIDPAIAIDNLVKFRPMAMRFERIQLANGVRVVNDSYNANPESMRAAFRTVGSAKRAGNFIAAIGDMLELGDASRDLHRGIGEDAVKMGVDRIYVLGNFSDYVVEGAIGGGMDPSSIVKCKDAGEMEECLQKDLKAGDVLLVKGSRGMRMERVVDGLKNSIGMG